MATVTTSETANVNAAIVMAIKPNSNDTIINFLSLIFKCYPYNLLSFDAAKVRLFAHTAKKNDGKEGKRGCFVDTCQVFGVRFGQPQP